MQDHFVDICGAYKQVNISKMNGEETVDRREGESTLTVEEVDADGRHLSTASAGLMQPPVPRIVNILGGQTMIAEHIIVLDEHQSQSEKKEFLKLNALEECSQNNPIVDAMKALNIEKKLKKKKMKVDVERCNHLFEDVANDFNAIQDLALYMDPNQQIGHGQRDIVALMHQVLDEEEFITIWRSYCGGQAPAMGFMYHISTKECMTMSKFIELVRKTDSNHFRNIIDYMEKLIEGNKLGNVTLDKIEYVHFEKIAKELSLRPFPKTPALQKTWKNVASKAGLQKNIIDALDIPAQQDLVHRSLTENLFQFLRTAYPSQAIALIAEALIGIRREDVVKDCEIFKLCRDNGCLAYEEEHCESLKQNDTKSEIKAQSKKIQEEFDGDLT